MTFPTRKIKYKKLMLVISSIITSGVISIFTLAYLLRKHNFHTNYHDISAIMSIYNTKKIINLNH
jgi:hypothetical protein